jgi:hypothetical protein
VAPIEPAVAYTAAVRRAIVLLTGVTLALGGVWGTVAPAFAAPPGSEDCAPDARRLSGEWTTTETTDGENRSLWRGTLHLVQQRGLIFGRWEPPAGEPQRVVVGTFEHGVLRLVQRGTPGLAGAGVAPARSRSWLLSVSADGRLLTGRWAEPAGGQPARQGDLFATGESGCAQVPADGGTPAPLPAVPEGCAGWDLSGVWEVGPPSGPPAEEPAWRLWLLQDGPALLGWYEAHAGTPDVSQAWVVDGRVEGRLVHLQHHAGDSTTVARTLVLDTGGTTLSGAWPVPFGPPESEVLTGRARCVLSGSAPAE